MSTGSSRTGLMLWPIPGLDADFDRGLWAEQAGYDDLWLCDAEGLEDPITMGAALGVASDNIRLCTGIVPVFNRPPPLLATAVVAAERHARGRFVLGLGSSTENMIDRWYGLPYAKPLLRVRETVDLLRRLFAGEKSNYAGETLRSKGFQLKSVPSAPVPIYLAALGEKMLQLCGEIADGVVLNDFTPPDRLAWALDQIDVGAKRAGRRVEDLEIVKRRAFITTDKLDEGFEYFRQYLGIYGSAPAYQNIMINLGYRDAVNEIKAGFAVRDRARISAAIPDGLIERLFAFGDEARCRAIRDQEFADGIDTVIVAPQAKDSASFARTAQALAPSTS